MPVVSIITPVFDSAAFLGDAVHSVLRQTLTDWEMLIVDDGSTDTSAAVAREFAARDKRVRLIKLDRNSGSAGARNTAIEAADGRYIAFLDSDDQWLPKKLDKQVTFMRENAYPFTYTYYEKITEDGVPTGRIVRPPVSLTYAELLKSNRIGCLTAVYDSGQLGKVYMPRVRKRQDYGLWLQLLKRYPRAHCLPESLALYRIRPGSISNNKMAMLRHNWRLYRELERLSRAKSLYYLGWNVARKLLG